MDDRSNGPNELVSGTLRVGVALSTALLGSGLLWTLLLGGRPDDAPVARTASGDVHWNVALLLGGLLVLMATPIVRLAACTYHYRRVGDSRFATVSAGVLLVVAASILLSVFGVVGQRGH